MDPSILKQKPVWLMDTLSLPRARVHEIMGSARESFAIIMATKTSGPILWIGRARDVCTLTPSALIHFIDPARIILTEGSNRKEVLWAAEQALRSRGAPLTIIQLALGPDLKESRRLQLAAEQGRGLGLVLIERRAQSSAAQTRWHCEPKRPANDAASKNQLSEHWDWELTKNKSGPLGRWSVNWETGHGTPHHVRMVP